MELVDSHLHGGLVHAGAHSCGRTNTRTDRAKRTTRASPPPSLILAAPALPGGANARRPPAARSAAPGAAPVLLPVGHTAPQYCPLTLGTAPGAAHCPLYTAPLCSPSASSN